MRFDATWRIIGEERSIGDMVNYVRLVREGCVEERFAVLFPEWREDVELRFDLIELSW